MTVKTVTALKDIPSDAHFVIVTEESFRYDDGYGSAGNPSYSTHDSLSYTAVSNIEELRAKVRELDEPKYSAPKPYRVLKVTPVEVVKHVTFEINEGQQ